MIRTELMVYYPGPRLTTGWHIYRINPSSTTKSTAKNLKTGTDIETIAYRRKTGTYHLNSIN